MIGNKDLRRMLKHMLPGTRSTETARGVISSAQEGRFMLACDDGRLRLMVLGPSAGYEPQDLPDLVRRRCPVVVRIRAAEGRRASVVERMFEL